MIRGGYKIIDLKNKPFRNEVGMVYDGIYDAIEGTRKPILVSGINLNGYEMGDIWLNFILVDSYYTADFKKINDEAVNIKIEDTDVVTMTFAE